MGTSFENGCPVLAGAVQVGVAYRSDILVRSGEPWLIDNLFERHQEDGKRRFI
jgi:hypothetical protein